MRRLWRRGAGAGAALRPSGGPDPGRDPGAGPPVVLIGDLHGRADLLEAALGRVAPQETLVTLGDHVDRGPESAAVLRRLRALGAARPGATICLMGNHERMMLDALAGCRGAAARWLRHGGRATLESFGVAPPPEAAGDAPAREAVRALGAAMGPDLVAWTAALPLLWEGPGIVAAHAGCDARPAPARQGERSLLWGDPLARPPRRDGLWVVHGHVPEAGPSLDPAPGGRGGRIGLDTGAWRSGRLGLARIGPGAPALETVDAGRPPAPQSRA